MRTLVIPLLLATTQAMAVKPANSLFVVVHSVDRVVVDYYCQGEFAEVSPDAQLVRSTVLAQGSLTWHATGGTPPYTVIKDIATEAGECITVMDADGNTATGCGSIHEEHTRRYIDCSSLPDSTHHAPLPQQDMPNPPVHVGTPPPNPPPGPGPKTKDPSGPGKQPPPPPRQPGPAPKDPGHVTGGENPTPPPHPPVGPDHTPERPPVRRIAPAPPPAPHGTTTPYHTSSPTGGGNTSHPASHPSGTGSGTGTVQRSPAPH